MKLHQIDKLINENYSLVANCIGNGKYIGCFSDNVYEIYKNCSVVKIEHSSYFGCGLTIWIEPNQKLQKKLCKNCSWDTCSKSPKYDVCELYGLTFEKNKRKGLKNNER